MSHLKIGDVSRKTGLAVSAIRYYEAYGLLPLADRQANNRRCYGADTLDALQFISACRKNAMGLAAIRDLRRKLDGKAGQCDEANAILQTTIKEISLRIAELQAARLHLSKVASACNADKCGHSELACNIATNIKVPNFA